MSIYIITGSLKIFAIVKDANMSNDFFGFGPFMEKYFLLADESWLHVVMFWVHGINRMTHVQAESRQSKSVQSKNNTINSL